MSIYRGRLDRSRPYKGIQVVAYQQATNNKADTVVTDKFGYYQFNDLTPGSYNVYFYGGGYEASEYITIFVTDKASNTQFYVSPENGTVIKNGSGTLSVQLKEIFDGKVTNTTSGPVKLYIDNNGTYELLSAQAGVTLADDYKATVPASLVEPTLIVYAVADAGTDNEFIYDTITLADITDGVGFIGWVTPTSYLAVKDEAGTINPDTISLTPNFAIDGATVDVSTDGDFSFTDISVADDAANGISVNETTGVITVDTALYFDDQTVLTVTWDAEYIVGEQTFSFSVTESIYRVIDGTSARSLKVLATGQAFVKPKDSAALTPDFIQLTTEKVNLGSETVT